MPGGSDSEFNALFNIACQTGLMADAAGGGAQSAGFSTEDDLVDAIACNLRETVEGLAGTPCDFGWVNVDDAWTAILFYSAQLTGLTGSSLNALGTSSIEAKIIGTICNLEQVAINTGGAADGVFLGSYLQTLNALGCVVEQIVENGFGPPPATNRVLLNDGSGSVLTNLGDHVLLNS